VTPLVASSTACISASTSSGAFGVLVSSGAATAASTFSGPAIAAEASAVPAPATVAGRRETLTAGSRPSGPTSPPVLSVRRISSTGSDSAGPSAINTTSAVLPGASRPSSPPSNR